MFFIFQERWNRKWAFTVFAEFRLSFTLVSVLKYDISLGSFRRAGMWLNVDRVESGLVFASTATSILRGYPNPSVQ